jgi:RNA polymerase sigma factor (sigma-70 family)
VTTASHPHAGLHANGRIVDGAAAARTADLYASYGRTVHGLCRALLRDHAEAEDAAQQTFLSAHRAILNGSEPREPAAWLATIARNECWGRIRSRMREPLPSEAVDSATAPGGDPLDEAIRRADLAALWRAIESLPRQQRDALLLREFGGLSYGELAAALAVSAPAVESLLFRARTRLRAAYASVTGASWLDAFVRLLAGGGAPAAAKVAAIGVGAAAVTGGAVVGPQLVRHRAPARAPVPANAHHAAHTTVATTPVIAPAVIVPGVHVRPSVHDATQRSEPGDDRRRGRAANPVVEPRTHSGSDDSSGGGDGSSTSSPSAPTDEHGSGSGDDPIVTAPADAATVTTTGDDGGDHGGHAGSGDGSGGGDGGAGGRDGGGGSSGSGSP